MVQFNMAQYYSVSRFWIDKDEDLFVHFTIISHC